MKHIVSFTFTVLLWALPAVAEQTTYMCPMHPHYTSHEEGSCPICGMDLVAVAHEDEHSGSSAEEGKILYWVAPMDPNYRSDKPGKSPMGMDLVPVYADGQDRASGASVRISAETIQNMGVRTAHVGTYNFGTDIRSIGMVMPNERRQKKIYSRVEGWITDLGVSAVGDEVKEGDHLYTIHSPDLVIAQQDLLSFEKMGRRDTFSKLLSHYDVDPAFADALKKTREVKQDVPYAARYSGTVSQLNIRPGSYVMLNQPMFVLEDYRALWIMADIAEQDLPFLSAGEGADILFPSSGQSQRSAKIDYIYPTIDPMTRTGKVRLVIDNEDGALRPGAFVDVVFKTDETQRLAVPNEALLRDKDGYHVIRALGDGRFAPQGVEIGITGRDHTEILSGLKAGDKIVTSGQFLIDSESSLKESFQKMGDGHEH